MTASTKSARLEKEGLQIYAPEREEALLRELVAKSDGKLPEKSIRAIYREIMSAALHLEDDLKIAYLGPEGTWTHQAAIKKFGHSVEYQLNPTSPKYRTSGRRKADYESFQSKILPNFRFTYLRLFVDSHLRFVQNSSPNRKRIDGRNSREEIKTLYLSSSIRAMQKLILQHFPKADLSRSHRPPRLLKLPNKRPTKGPQRWGDR